MTASCGSGSGDPQDGCNTLADDAPAIRVTAVADSPAPPVGGKIADGTYVLSAVVLHTGPGGSTPAPAGTLRAVFQIQGSSIQQVGALNGVEKRYTTTFATSGSMVTTNDTCPTPKTETHSFSATNTEFHIYDTDPTGTVEQVYSRR